MGNQSVNVIAVLILLFCWGIEGFSQENTPKGVILIVVDDFSYGDIDILFPSDLETPSIDMLYKQSIRLTDFHVGTTCSPSRASIMTGRHVNAGGVWHTIAGRELLRESEQTMADVFKANGWATGVFGKWHLGEGYPFSPRFRGFDDCVIHGGGGVGQGPDFWGNDYYSGVNWAGEQANADTYFENGKPVQADRFCTDYWFEKAKSFIKTNLEDERQFFCYLPTNAAHGPFNAPHGAKKGFDGLVENVDENVGKLDAFLETQGVKDDVFVIFTCDNGTAGKRLGGLRQRKGSHYDGGHNVPCFIRWKNGGIAGIQSKSRNINSLTAGMDFLPTFIDMFELNRPEGGKPLHGISLKEMLLNEFYEVFQRTLVVDTQRAANLVKWKRACVMQDEIKNGKIAHKWRLIRKSAEANIEIYDFLADRDTDDNLVNQNPKVENVLTDSYDNWWGEVSIGSEMFPPFVLNDNKESELNLFAHSWIGNDGAPWHQNSIRDGAKGTRIHSVRFDQSGVYRFELRRWPREDGSAIAAKNGVGIGKEIEAREAKLKIKGVGDYQKAVDLNSTKVVFDVAVNFSKPTTLETAFLNDSGEILAGAYYVYIQKIGEIK